MSFSRNTPALCAFFFIGISLVCYWLLPQQAHYMSDSHFYLNPLHTTDAPPEVQGYAWIIAGIFKLCGNHIFAIVFFQILCVLSIFFYGQRIAEIFNFSQRQKNILALLLAVNLGFLTFTQLILAEIVFVFALSVFIFYFLTFLERKNRRALFISALCAGCSILIKPSLLFFAPLILPTIPFRDTTLFLLLWYTPAGIYALRNYVQYGTPQLSRVTDVNLYTLLLDKVAVELPEYFVEIAEIRESKKISQLFYFSLKHPVVFTKIALINISKTLFGLFTTDMKVALGDTKPGYSFFKNGGSLFEKIPQYLFGGTNRAWIKILALIEALWNFVRIPVILLGTYVVWRRKKWALLYFLGMYVAYFLIITVPDGCARLRMPIEPIFCILMTYSESLSWKKRRLSLVRGLQGSLPPTN